MVILKSQFYVANFAALETVRHQMSMLTLA